MSHPPSLDVQRVVLCANKSSRVRHGVACFGADAHPAHFLYQLAFPEHGPGLTTLGSDVSTSVQLSVGITFKGLQELRLPERVPVVGALRAKAPAFVAGAAVRASAQLGDTGPSAPVHWEEPFSLTHAHALVSVHADDEDQMAAAWRRIEELAEACKVRLSIVGHGERLETDYPQSVHFGYRDGLSQVLFEGWHDKDKPGRDGLTWHALGEVLLGREQDSGANPWLLPDLPEPVRSVFHDGSFGVFRKIRQDEPAFREFVEDAVDTLAAAGSHGKCAKPYVMAKLCGRWPAGQPVLPEHTPEAEPQETPGDNFNYKRDPHGVGCPFGAHTRRLNPRGDKLAHFQRARPLVRRGMPYGPLYDETEDPDTDRGLLGLFFCTSIEDQFEHLVGQWMDRVPLGSEDRGNAKDPLAGQHEGEASRFEVPLKAPAEDKPREVVELQGLRPFTRTLGTLYLFYPSGAGLKQLLSGAPWAEWLE